MISKKKNVVLDGLDRDILRVLNLKRPLVSSKIAQCVGLSTSSISNRLNKLKRYGILRKVNVSKVRVYSRNFSGQEVNIRSPRCIYWDFDLKENE